MQEYARLTFRNQPHNRKSTCDLQPHSDTAGALQSVLHISLKNLSLLPGYFEIPPDKHFRGMQKKTSINCPYTNYVTEI